MQMLRDGVDLDAFFSAVASGPSILMLDYDGTLAPFVEERDQAVPYPGVRELLIKFVASDTVRTVIVSGRSVKALQPLLGLDTMPEVWGSHGAEHLDRQGRYRLATQGERLSEGLAAIYWWARDNGLLAASERKPTGIAFHWRGRDHEDIEIMERAISDRWANELAPYGLELHRFDGGLEVRVAGLDKGAAVRSVLSDSTEDQPVAYLGDDLTDEDAFTALPSGRGLAVLVRPELRPTAASVWLRPPDELLEFLRQWLQAAS